MHPEWNDILDECLDRVLQRGETLEQCLADYPDQADELRPLLQAALETRQAHSFVPDRDRKRVARQRLFDAVEKRYRYPGRMPWLSRGWRRWATLATGVFAVFLLGGAGTVAASNDSLPGDPLYPVKRSAEELRLVFTFSRQDKAELHTRLADQRVREMAQLVRKGKPTALTSLGRALDRHLSRAAQVALPAAAVAAPVPDQAPDLSQAPPPQARPVPPTDLEGPRALVRERVRELLEQDLERNEEVLEELLEEAPESARPALRVALEKVQETHRRAVAASKGRRPHREDREQPDRFERKVEGVLMGVHTPSRTIRVRTPAGEEITLRVTAHTEVKLDGDPTTPARLRRGDKLEVKYNARTKEAYKIEAERDQSEEQKEEDGSRGPGPTHGDREQPDRFERKVEGVLMGVHTPSRTIRVRTAEGAEITLRVTAHTEVELDGDDTTPANLRRGDRLEVEYDARTKEAYKIDAEREEQE